MNILLFKQSKSFKIDVPLPACHNNIDLICSRKVKMKSSRVLLVKALKTNCTSELCSF